jgi:hypothetical protein
MSRTTHSRRPLQRLGLAGIGSAVLLVGIAPAANAAPAATVPLDPATPVELLVYSVDNEGGPLTVSGGMSGSATPTSIAARFGGNVTFTVPSQLAFAGTPEVELTLDSTPTPGTPKTYSSTATLPADQLAVTNTGSTYTVTLPADDVAYADAGTLTFVNLDAPAAGLDLTIPPVFEVALTSGAAATVPLDTQLIGVSDDAGAATLTAGASFDVTLPSTGEFTVDLGITDFADSSFELVALDTSGDPTGAAVPLTATVSGATASLTLPADLSAGDYELFVVAADGADEVFALASVSITVAAPAAAPAAPAAAAPTTAAPVNAGLRSNTGVEAVETGASGSVAIAVGAGMLALAGVGGVAVARTRRRPAAEGGTCA